MNRPLRGRLHMEGNVLAGISNLLLQSVYKINGDKGGVDGENSFF